MHASTASIFWLESVAGQPRRTRGRCRPSLRIDCRGQCGFRSLKGHPLENGPDESLEDADNLPAPEIIAREIVEDLTAALAEFEAVALALEARSEALS